MEQRPPVNLPDGPLLTDLRQRLRLALDFELVAAERIAAIRARLQAFHEFASGSDVSTPVRRLCSEIDVRCAMERLLDGAVAGLSAAELAAVVPSEDRRLDSGDFAPHNVLVRPDGGICVLDFENAGWDQPAALTACFLTAATCLDLGREQADAFLRTYRDAIPQDDTTIERFERFRALMHVFWCAIHISLTTPAHLARKRFANPDLDVEAVTADQVAQFRRRLPLAEAAVTGL